MTARPLPPISYLHEAVVLCSKSPTGIRWRTRPRYHFATVSGWKMSNTRDAGRQAGGLGRSGDGIPCYTVKINQTRYLVHRVVYALSNGCDPFPMEIDHIDGNQLNNLPENLRVATRSENACNKRISTVNTSGIVGVTFCKRTAKWMAQIGVYGGGSKKNVFLGRFDKIEDAAKARAAGEVNFHGKFSGLSSRGMHHEASS